MAHRLLAVHAHPDDESSKGAATMARYVARGADVLVATCTGGERGDVLNPRVDRPEVRANLAAIRREEMAAALAILGVRQRFLGFVDSWLPGEGEPPPDGCFAATPLDVATEPLMAAIRDFRPHVVITYDETGGYPHPDHIRTHEVGVAAFDAAPDPGRFPLPPVTTRIRYADWFDVRDKALLAHATQIDPDGPMMSFPRDLEREVWPFEDYHLARSLVTTATPEDDLFAGSTDHG